MSPAGRGLVGTSSRDRLSAVPDLKLGAAREPRSPPAMARIGQCGLARPPDSESAIDSEGQHNSKQLGGNLCPLT